MTLFFKSVIGMFYQKNVSRGSVLIRNYLTKVIMVSLMLLLVACGGNKVEITTDDSADYQSAQQLPPLKKITEGSSAPVLSTSTNQPSVYVASNTAIGSDSDDGQIRPSIVENSNNTKRMKIDADLNASWNYLLSDLRRSTVTVHSRNKTAGLIEIGCGEIDDGSIATDQGGWKVFKKDNLVYEYCVLQLTEGKGDTLVSLLNRRGNEVNGSQAMTIFNQILNK